MIQHILGVSTFERSTLILENVKAPVLNLIWKVCHLVICNVGLNLLKISISLWPIILLVFHINFREWKHCFKVKLNSLILFHIQNQICVVNFKVPVSNKVLIMTHSWFVIWIKHTFHHHLSSNLVPNIIHAKLLSPNMLSLIFHTIVVALPHEFVNSWSRRWIKVPTAYYINIITLFCLVILIETFQQRKRISHNFNFR